MKTTSDATATLVPAHCPACDHRIAARFFDAGQQPLATLGWPASREEAVAMTRYEQDFVQCPACTHVWNRAFRYEDVPYQRNPNRMFNKGALWKGHLATSGETLLARLPQRPTVVEIGCGEGHFIRGIAQRCNGGGRFVGFDPNTSAESGNGIEFHARLFDPLVDMPAMAPDAILIRHCLEHLTDPAALVEALAWGATRLGKACLLFVESPCIDRVFKTRRLADFYFEHVSQFTTESFRTLLARGGDLFEVAHGYDGEVIYALVRLGVPAAARDRAEAAAAFLAASEESRDVISAQLDALAAQGARVAIWGGTGKGAAFMQQFGADADRFPLVVDSDAGKAGTHVPGLGQRIEFRDVLKDAPVDVLIIPTQWRARDIVGEMEAEGIRAGRILIEHEGRLIDFLADPHPYRMG
jgi:SAM-dependent methyltransferase